MKKRINKIFNNLEEKPDVILIKNSSEPFIDENFFYVTGLEKGLFEGSLAILYPDGCIDIIVTKLEEESAKKSDANIKVYTKKDEFKSLAQDSVSSNNVIGLNFNGIMHSDFKFLSELFPKNRFIDVSRGFTKSRMIKDDLEISKIKKSCGIVDRIVDKIPSFCKKDVYEYELAAEINYLMQKYGADKPAFDTISSFGENSAEPHYTHGDTVLKNGDFVLCDFGACCKKYNSDTTRTFVFGKADSRQKEMYETVLQAQNIGLKMIRSGIKAHEVHDAVDSFINKSKFKGCFIHSTGHSLGLAVHDGGVGFAPECEIVLEENMVLTVEPGVYIPGFGGVRLEDDVVVKKDGCEILTQSIKNLAEI